MIKKLVYMFIICNWLISANAVNSLFVSAIEQKEQQIIPQGFTIVPCILHFGQSNCEGKSQFSELVDTNYISKYGSGQAYTGIKSYGTFDYGHQVGNEEGSFHDFINGVNNNTLAGSFGIENSMLKSFSEEGKQVWYIKFGLGGSALVDIDFTPIGGNTWYPTQNSIFPNKLKPKLQMVFQNAYANYWILNVVAIIWQQGETESSVQYNQDYDNLRHLYKQDFIDFRDSLIGAINSEQDKYSITIGRNPRWFISEVYPNNNYYQTINNAFYNFRDNVDRRTVIISTANLDLRDSAHYTADSNINLGIEFFRRIFNLIHDPIINKK